MIKTADDATRFVAVKLPKIISRGEQIIIALAAVPALEQVVRASTQLGIAVWKANERREEND